jgi:pSer/pThr/pTyr-binding forkhead associated (FHA) protein
MLPTWTKCRFCGATAAEQRAELEFVSGPLVGQTVGLDRDVTTIGSVAGNTVLLTDTGVSRKHIGIKRVDNGYELADLGSTNGVYVNGEKVARRKLEVGDVIRVGTTEIVFRV